MAISITFEFARCMRRSVEPELGTLALLLIVNREPNTMEVSSVLQAAKLKLLCGRRGAFTDNPSKESDPQHKDAKAKIGTATDPTSSVYPPGRTSPRILATSPQRSCTRCSEQSILILRFRKIITLLHMTVHHSGINYARREPDAIGSLAFGASASHRKCNKFEKMLRARILQPKRLLKPILSALPQHPFQRICGNSATEGSATTQVGVLGW